MKPYVARMIKEHSELTNKIIALDNYIYSKNDDDKVEYANKCIQLRAMKVYASALEARLLNAGIEITDDGEYYEKVTTKDVVETINDDISNCAKPSDENEPIFD